MADVADTLLRVRNLETYYGPIMAIRGVSFEVARGKPEEVQREPAVIEAYLGV